VPTNSTSIERVILNQEFNSLEENDGQVILAKAEGVNPINIGDKSILINGNKVLIKAGHGRYLVEVFKDQVDVLGISDRDNNRNMQTFQNLMNEIYDLNLQY